MVQSTTLNEVDLSFPVPPLKNGGAAVAYPNPARLSQQKLESIIDILDSDLPVDTPPEYKPNSPSFYSIISNNSTEKLDEILTTGNTHISSPPLYNDSRPMFLPTAKTLCVSCNEKSRYFGALTDITLWNSVFFQFISFVISIVGLVVVSALFTLSVGLFILFPIGPVISWASFVIIRLFGTLKLLTLPLTHTSSELCANCSTSSPPSYRSPELSYGSSKTSFYSKMISPLRSAYSWRCVAYFMIINPIVSVASFMISFASLVTGVILFPILPAMLRFIRVLSIMQKAVAIAVLSPSEN
ncbi:hypothetical protein BB561_000568 [Smittium simulii]|uniref:Uncharacterized protein n=1 Tax=Smittium simulii TaxID=133385 RepID=A0A2T9YYM7_9FUNG|nr:hypothetical protein BB561_000568 [Smittium simulii]